MKPTFRLITESPCFTVKGSPSLDCAQNERSRMFACGTEDGHILVADIKDGVDCAIHESQNQQENMSIV